MQMCLSLCVAGVMLAAQAPVSAQTAQPPPAGQHQQIADPQAETKASASSPPQAKTPGKPATGPEAMAKIEELAKLLVGSFDSGAQSARDPDYFDISLHMCRIWVGTAESRDCAWLYVEQAVTKNPTKPYRQRVYKVWLDEAGTYWSEVYLLPGDARQGEQLKFAGAWKDASKLEGLTPAQLTLKDGCAVALTRVGPGEFTGGTVGTGCGSDLSGAAYATSKVDVAATGLRTWDQGFDAEGNQVWGAEKGPYEFMRRAEQGKGGKEEKKAE